MLGEPLEVLITLWLIGRWVQLGLNDELLTVEEVIVWVLGMETGVAGVG